LTVPSAEWKLLLGVDVSAKETAGDPVVALQASRIDPRSRAFLGSPSPPRRSDPALPPSPHTATCRPPSWQWQGVAPNPPLLDHRKPPARVGLQPRERG
jgi:hypothetical protein